MIGEGLQSTNQRKHSYVHDLVEVGFFTDPSVCIGCKACEVACKKWNQVPDDGFKWSGNSYDNTGHLGASTWRHVMFLEQDRAKGNQVAGPMSLDQDPFRWVFLSDVCKHCEEAGCLEACPTGSIVRTETGTDSEKWNYVRDNPVRAGLVSKADEWKYAGEIETLML
jgi:Fe-S-cluster-containing dehydrogenase component